MNQIEYKQMNDCSRMPANMLSIKFYPYVWFVNIHSHNATEERMERERESEWRMSI